MMEATSLTYVCPPPLAVTRTLYVVFGFMPSRSDRCIGSATSMVALSSNALGSRPNSTNALSTAASSDHVTMPTVAMAVLSDKSSLKLPPGLAVPPAPDAAPPLPEVAPPLPEVAPPLPEVAPPLPEVAPPSPDVVPPPPPVAEVPALPPALGLPPLESLELQASASARSDDTTTRVSARTSSV